MDQKELEEEQRLIAVNQIKRGELKAKQMMYASSTTFGRKMVSQYTLKFAEFLKNKIESTLKGRAISRNFVHATDLIAKPLSEQTNPSWSLWTLARFKFIATEI